MKAIKILIFVIIGILIIGIGIGAYIYFYTDTFKTNKEIFYKYASEEQLSKIIDFDSIKQLVSKLKSQNSEQNMESIINVSEGDKNIINNASISSSPSNGCSSVAILPPRRTPAAAFLLSPNCASAFSEKSSASNCFKQLSRCIYSDT